MTINKIEWNYFSLLLFSVAVAIIAYGFALTNFSLTVDGESIIFSDYSLGLGRWGANLIRYHLFNGYTPYFTLLLGLILLGITAVEICNILNLKRLPAYAFCALFLTIPQLSYQLVFTIQADTVPFGFLLSVLSLRIFYKHSENLTSLRSLGYLFLASLMLMFALSMYQSIIYLPLTLFVITFFQKTYLDNFNLKSEIIKCLYFGTFILISSLFYYASVKWLCPPVEGGYLSSYVSGESNNRVSDFLKLWYENLKGKAYYGNKLTLLMFIGSLLLAIKILFDKKLILVRLVCLITIILLPYSISFFITGEHPPRLYVSTGTAFSFIICSAFSVLGREKLMSIGISMITIANIYFITSLYYSTNKIYEHDKALAQKIDLTINLKYPDFDPATDYVYFYGSLSTEHHQLFRLPDSDAFGGSLFYWDGGNNWRIINFFRFNDVAYYKMLDSKEAFDKIQKPLEDMPIWPKNGSILKVENVVVVKLGSTKGAPLPFE